MCFLVRQHAAQAEGAAALPQPGSDRLRPRWAGAVAAMRVGGLALAAVVVPAPTSPLSQAPAGVTTVAANTGSGLTGSREAGLSVDDGVPTADGMKAKSGDCQYGI